MRPSNDREAISLILDGLTNRGVEIVRSWDGEGEALRHTSKEATLDWLMSCDDSTVDLYLPTGDNSWAYFVLGNEPEEVVCDHHINLSPFIDPIVNPWWDR